MPAPVEIELPGVGVDLHGHTMASAGGQNSFDVDVVAGTAQQLPPRHMPENGRTWVGNRAQDALGLLAPIEAKAAMHAGDDEVESASTSSG